MWTGSNGSVRLADATAATLEEWRFEVPRPFGADVLPALADLLDGVKGHFIVRGGFDEVCEAARAGVPVVVRCEAGIGTFDAEVTIDPRLARLPNITVEVFPFTVTGDVRPVPS
jgi:hypothetical protein